MPPPQVTVDVWRVSGRSVPRALVRVAADRVALRSVPGLRFARLLGTSRGFSVRDADLRRWVLVAAWNGEPSPRPGWDRLADEHWRVTLRPLASRGRWSGQAPFGDPAPARWEGPVAALTRARLAPRQAMTFWRAVPPVAADLRGRDGLLATFGIGEAPIGWQGTFSAWRDAASLRAYAYDRTHSEAIRRTADTGWYAEELFARFAVLGSTGTLDGIDPLS